MNRVRVLLAEDHETVRDGLRLLFGTAADIDVVSDVADGEAAVEAACALGPDVAVLDLSMPGMTGLAATRAIRARAPHVAVVVLTRHTEHAYIEELLAAGAQGYILKQSPFVELLQAVRAAAAGASYLDPAIGQVRGGRIPSRPAESGGSTPVTDREMSVLRLSAVGKSNKEIAASLSIAVKTVEVHK